MARKKPPIAPPEKVALYDAVIATNPDVVRKGAANVYTSLNGHMFSFLGRDGSLALRMSKSDREAFVEKFNTSPVISYGAVMKEYVAVPDDLFADTAALKEYFDQSYAHVSSLKPKPTTRKKKT